MKLLYRQLNNKAPFSESLHAGIAVDPKGRVGGW